MSLTSLSDALAEAVEAVRPSLLGARRRRGLATLTVISPHLVVGTAMLARRPPSEAVNADGTALPLRFLGASTGLDLAVFHSEAALTPVTWSDDFRVGNLVVPIGFGPRATLGMISQLGGPWTTPSGHSVDRFLHVDGTLPLGFGGGPLVAADGRVVGINVRRLVRGGTTLTAATVVQAAETLHQRSKHPPGFLGIGGATATLTPAQAEIAGQNEALLVVAVEPDSPAADALTVGDILLGFGSQKLDGVPSLRAALIRSPAGSEAVVRVLSGGTVTERTVTLGGRPDGLG